MLATDTHLPARRRSRVALAPRPAPVVQGVGLGIPGDELEELITAAHDRLDALGDPARRARLERGVRALEDELAKA